MDRLRSCLLALATIGLANPSFAQVCPSPVVVNGTVCTVPLGTTVTVTPAGAIGLNASGAGGQINGNGIAVNLGAATTVGVLAQLGATVFFDGSTVATTAITTATAAGQIGLQAIGSGSLIGANGFQATLGPPNGTTAANNLTGVNAQFGGTVRLLAPFITMLGGTTGLNNHALVSDGAGSSIDVVGGTLLTRSRASFGALAQNGGHVLLDQTIISTTGVGTAVIAGGHALVATGSGSQINGADLSIDVVGNFSSGVRAENGGAISLTRGTITSSATSAADTDPAAGARAASGGSISLTGSTISMTGQRGTGVFVQDAGSLATLVDTNITIAATANRASAVHLINGGQASVTRGILDSKGPNVILVDSGSSITLTDAILRGTNAPTAIGYGLRVIGGSTATMTGGSSATSGRDSPGIAASGGGRVVANGVTVVTTGTDNSMGVIADLDGQITFNGGSVTTSGDELRSGARAHAFAARNPGGILTSDGTILSTSGLRAMGVVADDGGIVNLTNTRITTSGISGIGIFTVTEQTGIQFAASTTATNLVINTSGELAHGITSQSRNDISTPLAQTTVTRATVATTGLNAVGLRALLGDYGTRPVSGRGEARVIANDATVTTTGAGAHGALSRDNPTSVTMNRTSVTASGLAAHGSVAEAGGLIVGNQAIVRALGGNSAALFVLGTPGAVSTGNYTDSTLTNVSGPTIGVAGNGDVTLTRSTAGGSGEWLRVGQSTDFPPLLSHPPLTGIPDLPDPDPSLPPPTALPPLAAPPALPVVPGLANVTLTNSTVTGSAFTAPGSVSNLTLIDSTWIMTGSSNITNLVNDPSLIQYTPPTGDPTLLASYKTLTVVNYLGINGQIGLNTFLGTDGSPSDRLVINGGNASGSSPLLISNTTGAGDLTTGNGILVVETQNGGATVPGTFSLGRPVVAGPYEYSLYRGSVDASGPDNWYLRSNIQPEPPGPTPGPTPSPIPDYRREVSLYAALPAMGLIYGRTIIDSLHERVGELRPLEAVPVTEERTIWCKNPEKNFRCTTVVRLPDSVVAANRSYASAGWARIIGTHGDHDGGPGGIFRNGPNFDYDIYALQAGLDLYRAVNADGSRDHAGIYGAIGRIQGDVRHFNGINAGTNTIDGYSIGAYWTHFGASGWYLDGVVQGTWFDAEADSRRLLPKLRRDGFGFAASLEGGYPIALGNGWTIEPQAQIIYQTLVNSSGHDGAALVRFSDVESLAGRIGARLAKGWALEEGPRPRMLTAWLKASLWNEFLGDPKTSFSSASGMVSFRSDLGGAWGEVRVGVDAQVARNTALYASAGYSMGFDGRSHAYDGRLGVKVTW